MLGCEWNQDGRLHVVDKVANQNWICVFDFTKNIYSSCRTFHYHDVPPAFMSNGQIIEIPLATASNLQMKTIIFL